MSPSAWIDRATTALAAALVVAVGLLLGGDGAQPEGGSPPPAAAATRLVPADALVYVHLSTDSERGTTTLARQVAEGFPGWKGLRDGILARLSGPGCTVDARRLRGKEAALALLEGQAGTAGSLVLVDTGAEQPRPRRRNCGALQTEYIGRFLAIGQPASLRAARGLHNAGGDGSLAESAAYRAVEPDLPDDRVGDGWVSRDGVRSLLAPQGGVLGAAGVLLDQPALRGAAFSVSARGRSRAALVVRTLLDPKARSSTPFRPFRPTLQREVPEGAMAYVGVRGISTALQRVLAAAGPDSAALAPIVGRVGDTLLKLFGGEAALVLFPDTPAPTLVLLARTADEAKARRELAKLPKAVRDVFSTDVFDGKVAVATKAEGIRAIRAGGARLVDSDLWRAAVDGVPERPTSIVFLDFNRLLRLGEQTGLNDSRAYRQVKDDLQRVRAIGAQSSGDGSESTAEITLSIAP